MEGALGIEQLKRLPNIISERRKNAKLIKEILYNHPDIMIRKKLVKEVGLDLALS